MARPFIPFPHGAQVEIIGYCNSNVVENVFHIQHSYQDFTYENLVTARNVTLAFVTNYYSALYSNECEVQRIRSKALHSEVAPIDDYLIPVPIIGQVSEPPAPNNVTLCFKLLTGLTGRSNRGRWYTFGMTPSECIGNDANSYYISNMGTMLNGFVSSWQADSNPMRMVVASYRNNKAWRTVVQSNPVIEVSLTDAHLDSQRRRLTGRGRV